MASGAYFDHVTVVAEGGGERAVACFFPPDAPARQAAPTEAAAGDPCVDLLALGTLHPPTTATWDLSGAPRTVNFLFPDGVAPTITAYAVLGESAPVAAANLGAPRASVTFPNALITLGAASQAPGGCAIEFAPAGIESSALVCAAPAVTGCLDATSSAGRSSLVECVGDAAHVDPAGQTSCVDGGALADMVWRASATKPSSESCAPVVVIGRFVRCASGSPADSPGCPLTTECTPPPTLLGYANTDLPQQLTDISCLPPSLVPRALVVYFANERKGSDTRAYPFLIEGPVPGGDGSPSCFFDVQSIFVASSQQIACPGRDLDAGSTSDAGAPDGEASDAGISPDAAAETDAGTHDAGTHDAGTRDAGTHDAGTRDAGTHDAGN